MNGRDESILGQEDYFTKSSYEWREFDYFGHKFARFSEMMKLFATSQVRVVATSGAEIDETEMLNKRRREVYLNFNCQVLLKIAAFIHVFL